LRRPLIIAHRAHTPETIENSLAGVQAAVAAGADLVEMDIRLSLDRVPVLHHDAVLGRVSRGRGPVRALPAAALRRVPLRGGKGQTIPTLAQVLAVVPPSVGLALEIKTRGALRHVLRALREHNRAGQVWLWLSRGEDVELARQAAPDIPMTLLEMPWRGNVLAYLDRAHRLVCGRGRHGPPGTRPRSPRLFGESRPKPVAGSDRRASGRGDYRRPSTCPLRSPPFARAPERRAVVLMTQQAPKSCLGDNPFCRCWRKG
ncbi:MAG: hypothetical protein C4346_04105, partial [Chloroflexota bacterium]